MKFLFVLFLVLAIIFAVEANRNCEAIVCPEEEDLVCARPIKGGPDSTFLNSCLITVAECKSLHRYQIVSKGACQE